MPNNERVLGFSNMWYTDALKTADSVMLPEAAIEIRVVTAPYFFGTKLEAFKGRGKGDFIMSHDLEDLVAVLDGRPTTVDERKAARPELRMYIASEFAALLAKADFVDALPGLLLPDNASQRRLPSLIGKLNELAALK
jgi:predicted nucleotidyltransferase